VGHSEKGALAVSDFRPEYEPWLFDNAWLVDAAARCDAIMTHQPHCPKCETDQVQIKSMDVPARWRCRRCKHHFVSEPTE
jgi:transposase-like protein